MGDARRTVSHYVLGFLFICLSHELYVAIPFKSHGWNFIDLGGVSPVFPSVDMSETNKRIERYFERFFVTTRSNRFAGVAKRLRVTGKEQRKKFVLK